MKTTRRNQWMLAAVLAVSLLMVTAAAAQRNQAPEVLLQSAIQKEMVDGDLQAAIELYKKIAATRGVSRAVAVQALLHMGQCYEKLGIAEAQKAYERVVRDYADQPKEAAEARARLAALTQPASTRNASAMAVRQVWAGRDVDILGMPSPDGRYLSYVDWETGDQAVRDLTTGKNRRLTNKGSWFESIEFALFSTISRDGKQLAYSWFNKELLFDLRVIGLDGSAPRILYANKEVEYVQPFDWSPDGKSILAMFSRSDRTNQIVLVTVADASARVLKTLDWRYPLKMSFSPDGRYIVYDFPPKEDSADRDIFLLASNSSREIPLVEHPANDLTPVWAPDGKTVIFYSDRTGSMGAWLIQVADGKPQASPELIKPDIGRTMPMGFARNGAFYYGLSTGMNDVYIATLDVPAGKIQSPPSPVSQRFVGSNISPDWSADGKYLSYVSRRTPVPADVAGGLTIIIRSVAANEERELAPKLNYFQRPRWSPDARSFLVQGKDNKGRQGLYRIDAQTGDVAPVVQDEPGVYAQRGAWSPNGKAISYVRLELANKRTSIVLRDLQTGQEQDLHRAVMPAGIDDYALSPDGRQLAFILSDLSSGSTMLNIVPATGGEPKELLRSQKPDRLGGDPIVWTPDGRYLLFTKGNDVIPPQKAELWRISAEGGEPLNLGLTMERLRAIRVHPDGRQLAFAAGQNKVEVWVMENFLPTLKASK